ncbi:hypothetical protein [Dyadobacter sp. 32]|uniref:hypothetical protein n=1 Tax=Dyadobacter sp. 32 TaxID=538966 RepID=UPI0011F06D16
MKEIYYPLLKKSAWHCQNCMSTHADNLHFKTGEKDRYLLELFSGSGTVSRVAREEFGYRTFTIDLEEQYQPDLSADIAKLALHQIPDRNKISIVWASVPCTQYSILNLVNHWEKITYNHRSYYYFPKTDAARSAVRLLEKTLWLIRKINPTYYFIENPRGALRHMPQMNYAPFRHEISYSDFEMDIYKPTDIFTNCNFLKLPRISSCVGRSFPGSVNKLSSAYERSIVPPALIREILTQVDSQHSHSFTAAIDKANYATR